MSRIGGDLAGIVPTIYHYDEHTDQIHVERVQDVEPLLELQKAKQKGLIDPWSQDRDGKELGTFPVVVFEEFEKAHGLPAGAAMRDRNVQDALLAWLQKPDHAGFLAGDATSMHNGIVIVGKR